MEQKLLRDVRLLKWYAACSTGVILFLLFNSFQGKTNRMTLEELDVERINILEKNGDLKMVISNKERQHPGKFDGKDLPAREREAGIIFFNTFGDECGGLVYDGDKKSAGFALSIDQFRTDQIMQLQYGQDQDGDSLKRHYGLKLWDRSDSFTLAQQIALFDSLKRHQTQAVYEEQLKALKEDGKLGVERMFTGKTNEGEVGMFIRDDKGRVRIKIFCDRQNNPRIIVLDEAGREKI